jgi:hypothetical protein
LSLLQTDEMLQKSCPFPNFSHGISPGNARGKN